MPCAGLSGGPVFDMRCPGDFLLGGDGVQGGGRTCNCDGIRGMIVVDEESGN